MSPSAADGAAAAASRRLDPGMDLEEAFQVVGAFGPYQKRAVGVLVLTQVSVFKRRFETKRRERLCSATWL